MAIGICIIQGIHTYKKLNLCDYRKIKMKTETRVVFIINLHTHFLEHNRDIIGIEREFGGTCAIRFSSIAGTATAKRDITVMSRL